MDSSENATVESDGKGNGNDNGILATQVDDTTAMDANDDDDPQKNLNEVVNCIQKTLAAVHSLYLTVSSFNTASQLPLIQRLNVLVIELQNMVKLSDKCKIQVPTEVLDFIDNGKNPDEFTRDVVSNCISRNQAIKGQVDSFKSLRKYLLEELEEAFPDEVESYREIRAISAAESKQLAEAQSSLPNGDVKVKTEFYGPHHL